ncbi:MAG: L-aspartate oxidase [Actinobacteria bacterium]|nr:L-aspartate oxidase [Actinomycetota bacterium]
MCGPLRAPAPGWTARADAIVVGSGVAGLTSALHLRDLGLRVLLVTKAQIDEGSTRWAQGGIAAALSEEDSPEDHMTDTMVAGAGLCDPDGVTILVTEGPHAMRELMEWGARFDTDPSGSIALTREGGHHRDRIAHAGGDATGREVSRALVAAVHASPEIEVIENALVLDLLRSADGAAQGVTLHVIGTGQRDGVGAALAPAVILATGGIGQVFGQTTNPYVSTGDGVALAVRAGASVADIEFVQFHPTVLWLGPHAQGQQPLVSEAVRGEGAVLRDDAGVAFMADEHPLADLAPRDIVAKAIMRRMRATGTEHVWLDGRHLGADVWVRRFPTILESCRLRGIDPVTDLIPVAPAQHYVSGGVRTDIDGRSSIRGLYACGEVACTGVHGANRLASNSLLEGLVFSRRIAAAVSADELLPAEPMPQGTPGVLIPVQLRRPMQRIMDEDAGVLRSATSLRRAAAWLAEVVRSAPQDVRPTTENWETTNIMTIAQVLVRHALLREETRGSHWREDFPESEVDWQVRLVTHMDAAGTFDSTLEPVP